jgi:hypothetical protein
MARLRFNKVERELIARLGAGGSVEWRNVSAWHPATIDDPEIKVEAATGVQYVKATNHATTRRIHAGMAIWLTPGYVREPAPEVAK